jgi:hypothetical protein
MKPNPIHRLPAPLEAAVQRLKLAAREAAERTIESLGLAALAATHAFQRDGLLAAQFELNRKSAVFILAFNDAFDERMVRELGAGAMAGAHASSTAPSPLSVSSAAAPPAPTSWDALTLVEDREVEAQISAERFGLEVMHSCEWELRELDAYVATLLAEAGGERDRNPMRPEIVGHAMIRGVEAVTDRADVRKVLSTEFSRSLGSLLRSTYGGIVSDLRKAGVQPLGLTVRQRLGVAREGAAADSQLGDSQHGRHPGDSRHGSRSAAGERPGPYPGQQTGQHANHSSAYGPSTRHGYNSTRGGTPLGQVDPALMTLIRRLAYHDAHQPTGGGAQEWDDGGGASDIGPSDIGPSDMPANSASRAPLANLIHVHRDELRQASTGAVDHMVIDVIGFLFDQILADPKVPPQMARLLARLQLPVLRAALGDPSFFSSRKHPVRRFVNRIASLGAAFEDFSEDAAREFLAKVRGLVQEVVEGEFDQIEVYQQKLLALEAYVAEQSRLDAESDGGAAALLQEKEDELRLRQLYAERLAGELKDVSGPAFVRDFVSRVWSQVLLRAAVKGGPDGDLAQKLRRVGSDLMLSVQPKPTPAHRKAFLAALPKLMQDLTAGMNLIAWPEPQRRAFFGQLMPAHADALKSAAVRQLDLNLMAKQVEGALQRPVPSAEELRAQPVLPVLNDEVAVPQLSAEEALRVGLLEDAAVNWSGHVDIDLDTESGALQAEGEPAAPGLPAMTDAPEATQGRELVENIAIGFAYQMHLKDKWEKVRLAHVSPGRTFFMFTHGKRHKETVSLTQRMLIKLCETGRLRAYEQSTLIERATQRARRQLATLAPDTPRIARA